MLFEEIFPVIPFGALAGIILCYHLVAAGRFQTPRALQKAADKLYTGYWP
jgi:hypothetical protein